MKIRNKNKSIGKALYLLIFVFIAFAVVLAMNAGKIIFFNRAAYPPNCMGIDCFKKPVVSGSASLGFMGDLSLGRYVNKKAYDDNIYDLFDTKMETFLRTNYLNVANLESSIIGRNERGVLQCPISGAGSLMILCGLPEFLPEISRNHFIFTLANNHINDFESIDGKKRTMSELSKYGIPFYYSHDPAYEFELREKNGVKFGFLGFDLVGHLGFNTNSLMTITEKIKEYDGQVDWLVLSVHWGQEYVSMPLRAQIQYAHAFINAGADVIHGHHPHVLQPYEWYNDKLIFYSLGNFVFDQDFQENTRTSSVYRVTFTKDSIIRIIEYKIQIPKDGKTKLLSPETIYDKADRPKSQ